MSEWWDSLLALEKVFVALAFPFTLLTLLQLILELLGLTGSASHDGAMDHGTDSIAFDHDAVGFMDHFSFFTVRNLIYFLMMFGWTGLSCSKAGFPVWLSITTAVIAGLLTSLVIGWIFYMFSKLTESGNIKISSALDQLGTVYISIPEKRSGTGVIQLVMQGVTSELNAMTDGEKLSSGKSVKVTEVLSGNIVLVTVPVTDVIQD